ncbi:MAG: small, acid-soluble spore protein, H family [Clostridium sp.]|nr:small, acid-soluble spore protein, H family [Clostridium sp.]
MDAERIRQIIESSSVIEVFHEGKPVWIEGILNNEQVEISDMLTQKRSEVPAYSLIEKGTTETMH